MIGGSITFWRQALRSILVPFFVWLLAAQSIALPLARAEMARVAGSDLALTILCSSTLPVPGDSSDEPAQKQVHDFGCCTLSGRADLDLPVATLASPPVLPVSAPVAQAVSHAVPQSRAPPALTAQPRSARAPPFLV